MNDLVKFLSQLAPILKPDQRDKLAAKLDKGGDEFRQRSHNRDGAGDEDDED
jgi:hypothetical protein